MTNASSHADAADIGRKKVSAVYAQALLSAVETSGRTEAMLDELDALVRDVLTPQPKFSALLASPRLTAEEKRHVLERSLGNRLSPVLMTFLKVLARRNRLECLRGVAAEARALWNERRGVVAAELTTATPINGEMTTRITQALEKVLAKKVALRTATDADLIGGLVVRIGDRILDGSVANQLGRLRSETLQRAMATIRQDGESLAESK